MKTNVKPVIITINAILARINAVLAKWVDAIISSGTRPQIQNKTRKHRRLIMAKNNKNSSNSTNNKKEFPSSFPFWARMKIGKKRTALVIDEEQVINKKTQKIEDGFVHREATHIANKNNEKIEPNPDITDNLPMYLKRPTKKPKRLFEPHNKDLDMPQQLKDKYDKNNKKKQ